MVSNVKPALSPPGHIAWELAGDVLLFHPLPQLNTSPSNLSNVLGVRLRHHMEKMAEQVKMGLYSQKIFAKMNENGYLKLEFKLWS